MSCFESLNCQLVPQISLEPTLTKEVRKGLVYSWKEALKTDFKSKWGAWYPNWPTVYDRTPIHRFINREFLKDIEDVEAIPSGSTPLYCIFPGGTGPVVVCYHVVQFVYAPSDEPKAGTMVKAKYTVLKSNTEYERPVLGLFAYPMSKDERALDPIVEALLNKPSTK